MPTNRSSKILFQKPPQAASHLMRAIEEVALGLDPGHVPEAAKLLLVLGH